ncbi:hypothetical protein Csa_006174 [Cucumis sativus]|uniref:Uncharacterized protein n=1 Tax=Cucumis sativus TaxID=3659 RepID=A0A0A0LI52_CUCSA|nr:hypothetical protein Csa_006174 [Cucumis sativus]
MRHVLDVMTNVLEKVCPTPHWKSFLADAERDVESPYYRRVVSIKLPASGVRHSRCVFVCTSRVPHQRTTHDFLFDGTMYLEILS